MKTLNLPEYNFNLQKRNGKLTIFDPIRKKYVALTPEEWVRQHFLNYLLVKLSVPRTLVKIESGVEYNRMQKRSDILVFDRNAHSLLLVECKSYDIRIDQKAFEQASMYNHTIQAKYIAITNGMEHWCCKIEEQGLHFLKAMPDFEEMISNSGNHPPDGRED
jgi:hypothetical protein